MNSRSRRAPITAGELMAQLEADPEWVARMQDRERFRQKLIEENRKASAPVVTELRVLGFPIEWVSDLFNTRLAYQGAIPVLMKWLQRMENVDVKEAIVRALSVKWAKPHAAPLLIEEYRRAEPRRGLKWAIGNALSVVADDSVFEEIVQLVRDPQHGKDREMLAVALGNMKDPRAVDVLLELLGDEEVAGHALIALGKLKAERAKPHIERFSSHPKSWVRAEAKRALAKLDRAGAKR